MPNLNEMAIRYFKDGEANSFFGAWNVLMRYLVIGLVVLLITIATRTVREYVTEPLGKQGWWLLMYAVVLSIVSYEYINWTSIAVHRTNSK